MATRILCFVMFVCVGCATDTTEPPTNDPPMNDPPMGSELAAPSNLAIAELSGGAHLTWKDNSSNEAHFMIERMVHGEGDYEAVSTLPFDSTQFHDAGIVAGKTYMYRVTAMNDTDEASSAEVAFTLP